jgi:hypothetical protein
MMLWTRRVWYWYYESTVPFRGNPAIPRVWPIGCEFGVKTSAKNMVKLPVLFQVVNRMSLSNVGFLRIVSCAHGYVGSDVSSLCSEAMEVSREREHLRMVIWFGG